MILIQLLCKTYEGDITNINANRCVRVGGGKVNMLGGDRAVKLVEDGLGGHRALG